MRYAWLWLVGAVFFLPTLAEAQGAKNIKQLLSPAMQSGVRVKGGRITSFELGNVYMNISPAAMSAHGWDLYNTHISSQLDPALYQKSSAKNNAHIFKSLQRFERDLQAFKLNSARIASSIQSVVIKGETPYGAYLPKNLQNLYLGEVHEIKGLAEEVSSLIRQLPSIYPNRRIYLATEFLPAYEQLSVGEERTITDPKEVEALLGGFHGMSSKVIYAALEAGIPVVGLERENALLDAVTQETQKKPTEEMYEDFASSFEGVRIRNRMWAQYLRALRAADPEALIVVYAGFGHVGYNKDFNLPAMLGGRSFVVLFTAPEFLAINNSLFRYFREDAAVREAFKSSLDAKIIERWTKPIAHKKILGTDLTVILHPQP